MFGDEGFSGSPPHIQDDDAAGGSEVQAQGSSLGGAQQYTHLPQQNNSVVSSLLVNQSVPHDSALTRQTTSLASALQPPVGWMTRRRVDTKQQL